MELIRSLMDYWTQALVIAATAGVISLFQKYRSTQRGVRALLRNAIISSYNKNMERGFMPIYERENMEDLYKEYHSLGGNGVADDLKKKWQDLPTKKAE